MKSRFFVVLAIIALLGFVVAFNYGPVCAQRARQNEAPPEPFEEAKADINVEFSNFPDEDSDWSLDPEQVLFVKAPAPPDPINSLNYGGSGEVDALAGGDAALPQLIWYKAILFISFQGDPDDPDGNPSAVWEEDMSGVVRRCKWTQADLNENNPPGELDDLDAMQLWGLPAQADFYSLQGDPMAGDPSVKYSVFRWLVDHGIPYVPHSEIVAAVQSLGYEGPDVDVDLDAMMVNENSWDTLWNDGDTILFSIRAAGNWDGGEIVVEPFGGPAFFLDHGNHLWNTAFNVQAEFGVDTEEVDAIEAYPTFPPPTVPTLTGWGLIILVVLLVFSTVFVILRRRKAAVPG